MPVQNNNITLKEKLQNASVSLRAGISVAIRKTPKAIDNNDNFKKLPLKTQFAIHKALKNIPKDKKPVLLQMINDLNNDENRDIIIYAIKPFQIKNNKLFDFANRDLNRWCKLNSSQIYYTTKAFKTKNEQLINLINQHPEHWFKSSKNQMIRTTNAFETNNEQLIHFINQHPERWCELRDLRMYETTAAFEAKNEKLMNLINQYPERWCELNDQEMHVVTKIFEKNNEQLINVINQDPERWFNLSFEKKIATLSVFTKITHQNNRILIEPADELMCHVSEHLPAWFLSSSNQMHEIIAHYRPIDNNGLANNIQGIHNAVLENDSHKILKYLSEKCTIPTPEQTDEIFNDFKTGLDNQLTDKNLLSDIEKLNIDMTDDEKTALKNKINIQITKLKTSNPNIYNTASARFFMDSGHFNSLSKTNDMTLKQLLAVTINSADNNNMSWADGVELDCAKRKNDIKELLITALSDSQNAYDGVDVSCWDGAVNRITLALKPLIKQDETAMKWTLSNRDCYDTSSKNMIKILNHLNGDNTDIPDNIKQEIDDLKAILIEKCGDNLNDNNVMETIYPDIRGMLMKMNKNDYDNIPYLIHSITLKNSTFDDNVEYVNIPDGLTEKLIEKLKNQRLRRLNT